MEEQAPAWLAEPWDNVGLLAGKSGATVKKAWVALESSPELLSKAQANAQMLLLHHPPIFQPLKNLRTDQPAKAALIQAAASGLNIFAAHTNLDAAAYGVNHALAEALSLEESEVLEPLQRQGLLKLVVFVPEGQAHTMQEALFAAGAGRLGNYQKCSFMIRGQGQFQPMSGAKPALGRVNHTSTVKEARVEVLLPKQKLGAVLNALYASHPYEEPAFDIVPLLNVPANLGFGRVGNLPCPMDGANFLKEAARRLNTNSLQYAGPLPKQVSRVAVLGGSGVQGLAFAAKARAQVFITGEASHHSADEARDLGICLVLLGHFSTEVVIVKPWALRLQRLLKQAGFSCQIQAKVGKDPWRTMAL